MHRKRLLPILFLSAACSSTPAQQAGGLAGPTTPPAVTTPPAAGASPRAVSAGTPAIGGAAGVVSASAGAVARGVAGSTGALASSGSPAVGGGGVVSGFAGSPLAADGGGVVAAAGGGGVVAAAGGGGVGAAGRGAAGGGAGAAGSGTMAAGVPGCAGSSLLALPSDTTARGPWPVGEKTVKFGRLPAVEIFYPAQPGSEQGKQVVKYDLRTFLPKAEQAKVPEAEGTIVSADTYRDLPLDDAHGPYPVVIFVHGTASFRVGSFSTQALWASRGFVVMAADHPNLYLADYLGANGCNASVPALDLSGDVDSEIAALTASSGELAFLASHIDMQRVGISGHSAGAYYSADFSKKPGVQVVMPLAGTRAVATSSSLKSVLYVSGIADQVLSYRPPQTGVGGLLYPGTDTEAYQASPGPPGVKKRITGITAGGHLVVTDLCQKGPTGKSDLEVANSHGVCGVGSIITLGLADCGTIDRMKGTKIVNDITTAVLEETLQCQDRTAYISALPMRYPDVGDFKEAVK